MFRPASPRRPDAGTPLRRRSRFEALGSRQLPRASSLQPRARGKRFVIIASQFNRSITRALVVGATDVLRRSGASSRNIRLLWVPGAFE
ncbi:MAG: 6,7-dimethyl-8-ribityllumazine synthase, partial [Candidatus Omnitrophica bacterium]|nr:6,7-dimethyl-8-ribityllumazine synthase [Candidatus Omnitrophota bacterium]